MSIRSLMVIKAAVCLVIGVSLLVVPFRLFSLFGAELNPGGMFTAREYGAALIGTMFICWMSKNSTDSEAGRAIIIGLFIYDLIGFVATTLTIMAGILNQLAWFVAFIYLFFTVGFGYYMLKQQELKAKPGILSKS